MEGKAEPKRNEITEARRNEFESFQPILDAETQKKNQENVQYGKDLQQQIASRQQQRQWKYEDSLIENTKREEISRIMEDVDLRQLQRKQADTQHQRDDMATSVQDRKTFKDKQKEMNVVEDRQIEQQRQSASDRTSSIIAEREHTLQMRDEHNQEVGAKTFSEEEARLERDNITELVHAQEYLDKDAHDDQVDKEKSVGMKNDLKEALIDQIQTNRQDVLQQKEEDTEFTKQNEATMAVGDGVAREKEMKVKEKSRQYGQDLRQQIEDNTRRVQQHKREEAREQYVWDWDRDMSSKGSENPAKVPGSPQAVRTGESPKLK